MAPDGGVIAHLEKREFLPESALFCRLTPSTVLSPFKCPRGGKARSRVSHPGWEDCPSVLASLPPSSPLMVSRPARGRRHPKACPVPVPPLDQAPEAAPCCSCPFIWNRLFTAPAKRAFHPLISPPPKPPLGRDFKAPGSGFSPACGRVAGRGPADAGRKAAPWPRVHLRRPVIKSSSVPGNAPSAASLLFSDLSLVVSAGETKASKAASPTVPRPLLCGGSPVSSSG